MSSAEDVKHELVIDGLGVSGDGVGRLQDGRVVFVARAVPGDRVRVRLDHVEKRVQYAELLDVLEASPDRVESRCKVPRCGGCALRGISLAGQARHKQDRVVETLRRVGAIDVSSLLTAVTQVGDGWRSRHRVRLHAQWSGRRFKLGYHERKSRDLVALSDCPVLWSELEQSALGLGTAIESLPESAGLKEVELVYSRRDGRAAAKFEAQGPVNIFKQWLDDEPQPLIPVEVAALGGTFRHGNLELRYDHRRAAEFDLRYEPGVFTQANPEMNDLLCDAVLRWVRPSQAPRTLELHAGIGNFSVALALGGAKVTAVERSRRAAILSQKNAQRAGASLTVHDQTDEEAVRSLADVDVVLLDPPRTGARAAAQAIAGSKVARVVYVSCDVATLARDARIMVEAGYRVVACEAFDMFPETPHVETLLVLER